MGIEKWTLGSSLFQWKGPNISILVVLYNMFTKLEKRTMSPSNDQNDSNFKREASPRDDL